MERRYRAANDPVARSHWQMMWLRARGMASAQVAAVTGYTVNWVRPIAQRYNQHGPAGLEDRRPQNPGRMGLLSTSQRAALAAALKHPPPDGGIWTGPKAAAWMAATLGHRVHPRRGWEVLQRLGMSMHMEPHPAPMDSALTPLPRRRGRSLHGAV